MEEKKSHLTGVRKVRRVSRPEVELRKGVVMTAVLEKMAYFLGKATVGIVVEGMATRFVYNYFTGGFIISFEAAILVAHMLQVKTRLVVARRRMG